MTISLRVFRLAERNGISLEEAEDILYEVAEIKAAHRRDDDLFNQKDELDSKKQFAKLDF